MKNTPVKKKVVKKKKHAGGRPPKYTELELFQQKIDEYFNYCDNRTKEIHSEKLGDMILPDPQPYTMSGLARRLGMDRNSLINYSHKQKFFGTIREARDRVHEDVETRLMDTRNEKGAIFNLKNNFGWKDQSEVKNDISGVIINKKVWQKRK